MSYKIVKEDKKYYQVLHPDGSKFTVPKHGLSKDLQSKISKYPKLYDGTPDGDISETLDSQENSSSMPEESNDFSFPNASSMDDSQLASNDMIIPQSSPDSVTTPNVVAPMQAVENNGSVVGQTDDFDPSMIGGGRSSMSMSIPNPSYEAVNKLKKDEAMLNANMDVNNFKQESAAEDFMKHQKELEKQAEDNSKIKTDQGRFWHSMDTGNKILAAVSVALGGIGSGLTGKPNAALDIINKKIDEDIKNQKEDKDSLLNQNIRAMKNNELGYNVTKLGYANELDNILKKYGSGVKTAEGIQHLKDMQLKVDMYKMGLQNKVQKGAAETYLLNKAIQGKLPNEYITHLGLAHKGLDARYIPGQGVANSQPAAAEINTFGSARDNAHAIITELKDISKKVGSEYTPSQAAAKASILTARLQSAVYPLITGPAKSLTEGDAKRLEKYISNPTDMASFQNQFQAAADSLSKGIDQHYYNLLKNGGITPKMQNSFTGGGDVGKLPSNKGKF